MVIASRFATARAECQHNHHANGNGDQIFRRHRQQIAEQVGHQIDADVRHQTDHHQPQRQRAVRHDAQQGINRQMRAFFQPHQPAGQQQVTAITA
jgi:hypothetical protein